MHTPPPLITFIDMIAHKKLILQGVISAWCQLSAVWCEVRVQVHLFVMGLPPFTLQRLLHDF